MGLKTRFVRAGMIVAILCVVSTPMLLYFAGRVSPGTMAGVLIGLAFLALVSAVCGLFVWMLISARSTVRQYRSEGLRGFCRQAMRTVLLCAGVFVLCYGIRFWYVPFTYGFRERIRDNISVGAIRIWMAHLELPGWDDEGTLFVSRCGAPDGPADGKYIEYLGKRAVAPPFMDQLSGCTIQCRYKQGKVFETAFSWFDAGHHGLVVGLPDATISRANGYVLAVEDGACVWHSTQNILWRTPSQGRLTWNARDESKFMAQIGKTVADGGDINALNYRKGESSAIHLAAQRGYVEAVKLLLANNANGNVEGRGGWTPLHEAAYSGELQIAVLLLQYGIDANVHRTPGMHDHPLHCAARNKSNPKEMISLLLAAGASIEAQSQVGETPLHVAALSNSIGAAESLIQHGADVNGTTLYRGTPLHKAAAMGHLEMAELLLKNGANVNARDDSSRTPLYLAIEKTNRARASGYFGRDSDDFGTVRKVEKLQKLLREYGW